MQASAETIPMTWKEFDKAYVVFEMDVGPTKLAMVEEFYQIIVEEYGFPMVISTNTGTALANKKFVDFMRKLEDHGGEITSHTHSGLVCNSSVPWEKIDKDFKTSAEAMEAAGFNVNGIMLAGGGGTEDTSVEYRTEIEKITSKYFYYSDRYGVSEQFYNQRDPVFYRGIPGWEYTKGLIDELIANKSWKGIFTHGYNEVTGLKYDEAYLRRVLDYLKSKEQEGVLEVVTYKYVYENLANWAKPIDFGDTKYTVDFYTPDGKTLLGSSVAIEGEAASPPLYELADGYVLKGWSGDISKVTDNRKVTAKLEYTGSGSGNVATAITPHVHRWGAYRSNESGHWRVCENAACGKEEETFAYHVEGAPATADKPQTCTVCGRVLQVASTHVHSLNAVEAKAATCTERGTAAHYICRCGKRFADANGQKEITAADTVVAAAHTDADGDKVCDVCDERLGDNAVSAPTQADTSADTSADVSADTSADTSADDSAPKEKKNSAGPWLIALGAALLAIGGTVGALFINRNKKRDQTDRKTE